MRGLAGGVWLAAAATLLHVAKGDSVQFDVADFDGGELPGSIEDVTARKSIFQVERDSTPSSKLFTWMANGLKIDDVRLFVDDPDGPILLGSVFQPKNALPTEREGGNPVFILLKVNSDTAGGTVTIPDLYKAISGPQILYFEAVWPSSSGSGRSYSPAFAVLDKADTAGLSATTNLTKLFAKEAFLPEVPQRNNLGSGSDTSPDASLGSAPMPTPSTTTADDSSASITSVTSASITSASSGLSTGARAGIGAACGLLGLLLIAFAIWYFLRKKKRRQQHGAIASYDETGISRTRTDELMAAEKEANLSSSAAAASSSPYSDADATRAVAHRSSMSGGGGATAPLIAPVAVVGTAATAVSPANGPPSYTPYTDRPASGAGSGTGSAAEEPAVVSTQYAHLVEEGMTAEQIRRLEEEERALDAAIEQAVRRPTG